jgi:hypothetical protein
VRDQPGASLRTRGGVGLAAGVGPEYDPGERVALDDSGLRLLTISMSATTGTGTNFFGARAVRA